MDSEPSQTYRPLRFQFARFVWVLVSVGGILVSLYLLHLWRDGYGLVRSVIVREPLPDGTLLGTRRYFGFFDDQTELKARDIAEVTGPFALDTKLSASLYVVRSGKFKEIEGIAVGRSSNIIGAPTRGALRIRLALGEARTPDGWIVRLGSHGHIRAGGGLNILTIDHIAATTSRLFPGKLSYGKKCLIYVDGDQTFEADRSMTVEEFADKNRGNYLVVVGQLD